MEEPEAKIANRIRDLERWAEHCKLPFRLPTTFPIKTSRALRGAIAMRRWDREVAFIDAIFAAYWERDDASIQHYDGLRPIAGSLGVDPDEFEAAAESDECRAALIEATDRGLARGCSARRPWRSATRSSGARTGWILSSANWPGPDPEFGSWTWPARR